MVYPRVKTTSEMKVEFKEFFSQVLGTRVSPKLVFDKDVSDEELCILYDNLSYSAKTGIWP